MAFTNLRNVSAIVTQRGSELAAYQEVTDTSTYTLSGSGPFSMPLIISSSIDKATNRDDVVLEGGDIKKITGTTDRTFTASFTQQDVGTAEFLEYGLNGATICIVKQDRKVPIDGKNMWRIMPMCEEDPSFNRSAIGYEVEKNFNIINNTSAITIDLTTFNTAGGWTPALTCAAFTVPANQGYAIYSQSV